MRPVHQSIPSSALAVQLSRAIDWLGAYGNVSSSRWRRYRDDVQWLANVLDGISPGDAPERTHPTLWNSLYEASQLLTIHREFGGEVAVDGEAAERLKWLIKGPERYASEGGSTQSRDYAFELAFGARLKAAGYRPTFGIDSDIKIQNYGRPVLFECKRPRSFKQMRKLCGKAVKQLQLGLEENPRGKGVIVISLEVLLNSHMCAFVDPEGAATGTTMVAELRKFIAIHSLTWQRFAEPGIAGIVFVFPGLSTQGHTRRGRLYRTSAFHPFGEMGSSHHELLARLVQRVHP